MRAPRNASAACGRPHLRRQATMVSGVVLGLADAQQHGTGERFGATLGRLQKPALGENKRLGSALWGRTLNQPLTPQASAMRPTSMASAGNSAGSSPGRKGRDPPGKPTEPARGLQAALAAACLIRRSTVGEDWAPTPASRSGGPARCACFLRCPWRSGCRKPMRSMKRPSRRTRLSATTMLKKRTAFGAAAGESNDDHDLSFGW
jgi:hypothetical protein